MLSRLILANVASAPQLGCLDAHPIFVLNLSPSGAKNYYNTHPPSKIKRVMNSIVAPTTVVAALRKSVCAIPLLTAICACAQSPPVFRGELIREIYTNVPGVTLASLTNHARFGNPDQVVSITSFETPTLWGENYGQRIWGYLVPPTTGSYVFYLAADDQAALSLSTDASPANLRRIAYESSFGGSRQWQNLNATMRSEPIQLEAGHYYFVEALHKEGNGADNFGVAWQLPDGQPPQNGSAPISGDFLARAPGDLAPIFRLDFFSGDDDETGTLFSRSYTQRMPLQAGRLLPGLRVVADSRRQKFYAAYPHYVLQIDGQTHAATVMSLENVTPRLSWPTSITYDTKRDRALLTSLGGEGFLYAFPSTNAVWSMLSTLGDLDIDCITYSPYHDALFGLDTSARVLHKFSPAGQHLDSMEVALQLPGYDWLNYDAQLVATGENLVLLVGPGSQFQPPSTREERMYLINPSSRQTTLTYRRLEPTNQPPSITLLSPEPGAEFEAGKPVTISAWATDQDGPIQWVEFFLDGNSIGKVNAPSNGNVSIVWSNTTPGVHILTVTVQDDQGAVAHTQPLSVVVKAVGLWPPAPGAQENAAAASDGTNFLVVWQDRRHGLTQNSDFDIYGALVASNGTLLTPGGIPIRRAPGRQEFPAVVFGGNRYLVIWEDHQDSGDDAVHGVFMSRSGEVLQQPALLRISEGRWLHSNAKLAWNGSRYLVTWIDWRNHSTTISDIYGARVSASGEILDPAGLIISKSPLWQTWPAVASMRGEFMVVWNDMESVRGARVSNEGVLRDSNGFFVAGLESEGIPAIVTSGTGFVVGYHDSRILQTDPQTMTSAISGKRLSASGEVLSTFNFDPPSPSQASHVCLAADGSTVQAAWARQSTVPGIYGAQLTPSNTVRGPVMLAPGSFWNSRPTIAFNGDRYLVAYTYEPQRSLNPLPGTGTEIYAVLMNRAGERISSSPLLISSAGKTAPTIQWASPGAITYGTPLGSQQLNATVNVPGTFVYTPAKGVYLDAGLHTLTAAFHPQDISLYTSATGTVQLTVLRAPLTIRANNLSRPQGQPNPPLTATYTGLVAGDSPSSLAQQPFLTTIATTNSPPGQYPIVASGASDPNYTIQHVNGTLTVLGISAGFAVRDLPNAPGGLSTVRIAVTPPPGTSAYAIQDTPPVGWIIREVSHGGIFDTNTGKVKFGPFYESGARTLSYEAYPPPGAQGVYVFTGEASADGETTAITGESVWVIPGYHPAETPPPDWRMTLQEVTAYAAAWRKGTPWPRPPSPIPMSYVTKAAALWRGGEFYTIRPSITNAPEFWVNTNVPGVIRLVEDGSSAARRSGDSIFVQGRPVNLTLEVTPSKASLAYAVEEKVPTGWAAIEISQGGAFVSETGAIRWGPFLDNTPRLFTYTLVPDRPHANDRALDGRLSVDGQDIAVQGLSTLIAGCALGWERDANGGGWKLWLTGRPDTDYLVEQSAEGVSWNVWRQIRTPTDGKAQLPLPDGVSLRFYRAKSL